MKIMCLTPCLMLDNNREINKKCITENLQYNFDEYVIYDQCFTENDFIDGVTYIGHSKTKDGYVKPRNELFKYFYNSDCDYAFLIDANSRVYESGQNDLLTIFENLRTNRLPEVDAIFSTLGKEVVQARITIKQQENYFDEVTLIPYMNNSHLKKTCCYLHGTIIKNFKKYYNTEFYIDERCNPAEGINEDIYFCLLTRSKLKTYLAPTLSLDKPRCWASCTYFDSPDGEYHYPEFQFDTILKYVSENYKEFTPRYSSGDYFDVITLPRNNYKRDCMREYKDRTKKDNSSNYVDLF